MTHTLDTAERERIAAAIRGAESATAGEIRVVVLTRPLIRHHFYAVMWAALVALVLPWPLAALTALSVPALLSLQALTFVVLGALLVLTPLGLRVTPSVALRGAARSAALDQFLTHGMHQTRARTGVLIMVALSEHLVEVVADEGIHGKVGHEAWQAVCAAVLNGARDGRLADGLSDGVAAAGRILASHVPPQGEDVNELSDHIVVL